MARPADGPAPTMSQGTDYYLLLGVPESASADAIKRAYRARARACHPDHHPGDAQAEEAFKSVQRAYHVLSDVRRRQAYDVARSTTFGEFGWSPPRRAFSADGGFDPLTSLFFGDEAPPPSRGTDAEAQVRLTFDQALRGGKTEVRLADGTSVPLTVPQGVRSGLKVRVRERGNVGSSGERGDLYVTFRVEPAARFRREGDNLHVVELVSAIEAVLGTTRSITSAYGQSLKVQIPPGTQPGERLRLRGQGVQTPTRRGDLFVEVQVTVPRSLSDRQRAELEAAARKVGLL